MGWVERDGARPVSFKIEEQDGLITVKEDLASESEIYGKEEEFFNGFEFLDAHFKFATGLLKQQRNTHPNCDN